MSITIPVSIGELCDKFSILKIKFEQIKDTQKRIHVEKEILLLNPIVYPYLEHSLLDELKEANQTLWSIEDRIRVKERNHQFDDEFIQLARSVYKVNDRRAEIKQKINIDFESNLSEVKEYIHYTR